MSPTENFNVTSAGSASTSEIKLTEFCHVCYVSNRKLRTAQYAINIFVRRKKPKSLWFYSEEKRFFHKSNYINQKGIKIHVTMK